MNFAEIVVKNCRKTAVKRALMKLLLFAILMGIAISASAGNDKLVEIGTRPDVTVPFYYMKSNGAKASVILLSGGGGNIGIKDGIPTSKNFLVRSRDYFVSNGFNVAVIGTPSDKEELDGSFRTSAEHIEDIKRVITFLKKDAGVPVWLVGTSMGTISATAVATTTDKDELAGIVLTSSVTSPKRVGAVPFQKLDKIHVPVLVTHHELDACKICVPNDIPLIINGLKNSPVKKELYVKGGANPKGDPCQALHWHGFIGMEKEMVDIISGWIKNPVP